MTRQTPLRRARAASAVVFFATGCPTRMGSRWSVALAGWALLGAGVAIVAPAVIGAAPAAGELHPPVAIAAVTTVGYLGSFTGPPAIGALAELAGLAAALALVVLAAAAIAVLSKTLP